MNEMKKDLQDAIHTIADYCEFQVCHNCPLMQQQGCILMHETPCDWTDYIGTAGDNDG